MKDDGNGRSMIEMMGGTCCYWCFDYGSGEWLQNSNEQIKNK